MTQSIPKASTPNGKNLLYHLQASHDGLLAYLEYLATQGDIVQLGIFPAYFVNHPDLVQQILVTQIQFFHKPAAVKYTIEQMFGTSNLFSSDDEVWRVLRKAMQPAFHMQRISAYLDLMLTSTQKMMHSWDAKSLIDFPQAMMNLTMSITSQ